MAKRQSMKEIAEAAGVSIATVSRVINNKPDVGSDTRQRVLDELERRNYEYRSGAVGDGLQLIGFVNNYRQYPASTDYVANLLVGCQERSSSHAYNLVMLDADAIQKEMRWPGRYGVIEQIAGVVWSMPIFEQSHAEFLQSRGIPYVVINNLKHGVKAPFVESDNYTAVRQAVEYLIGMGHRRIGFIGGALHIANMEDRYKGYLQHMAEFDLEVDRDWVIDDLTGVEEHNAIEGTYRLLGRRNLPTALITASESVALGVYRVFATRGIRIPDDVSIVSFDDTRLSELMQPPVTTFRQHLHQMGGRAIDLLMGLIHPADGIDPALHVREPMTLIVRDSVAVLDETDAAGDP
ncbi:MAG: LacI family DNA-binding transcriptional regulator [Spirochaetota bacterium]